MKRIYLLLGVVATLMANNLRIQNIVVDQTAGTVTFDIAWDNSWRLAPNNPPGNWDAVWVFVKFRACDSPLTTPWTHGLISTNVADHVFGSLEPMRTDTSPSVPGIDAAPNNTGVMLRRNAVGIYPNAGFTTVTLKLTNLPATGDYEVRVFGIEMVYVPPGGYFLGTLSGRANYATEAAYAFDVNGNYNDPHVPYYINSEAPITIKWAWNATGVNLAANFPKGYKSFYCMKYEISQGQYVAFLNTLGVNQANTRFPNRNNQNRHRIWYTGTPPDLYATDKPDRACNWLSWNDVAAYLDWAALRPMTEMEYEKACRGPGSSFGEYAWGSTNFSAAQTINKTPEDGTEEISVPLDANVNCCNTTFSGGDGGAGPLRVGIFAKPNSTSRDSTGATYYGIMEMSGNLWEFVVIVSNSNAAGATNAFDGHWGDGYLDPNGNHNEANWPENGGTGTTQTAFGVRGGSWGNNMEYHRVSSRWAARPNSCCNNNPNYRHQHYGGRGVR